MKVNYGSPQVENQVENAVQYLIKVDERIKNFFTKIEQMKNLEVEILCDDQLKVKGCTELLKPKNGGDERKLRIRLNVAQNTEFTPDNMLTLGHEIILHAINRVEEMESGVEKIKSEEEHHKALLAVLYGQKGAGGEEWLKHLERMVVSYDDNRKKKKYIKAALEDIQSEQVAQEEALKVDVGDEFVPIVQARLQTIGKALSGADVQLLRRSRDMRDLQKKMGIKFL